MLEQAESDSEKVSLPPKQLIVNWIEAANSKLKSYPCIVKKSFLVTGLSNSLGGHENQLIRDDCTRREIEEISTKAFGEEAMGFTSQNDPSDHDSFDSDGSFSEKKHSLS